MVKCEVCSSEWVGSEAWRRVAGVVATRLPTLLPDGLPPLAGSEDVCLPPPITRASSRPALVITCVDPPRKTSPNRMARRLTLTLTLTLTLRQTGCGIHHEMTPLWGTTTYVHTVRPTPPPLFNKWANLEFHKAPGNETALDRKER